VVEARGATDGKIEILLRHGAKLLPLRGLLFENAEIIKRCRNWFPWSTGFARTPSSCFGMFASSCPALRSAV
jgi:hypothetical protein